MRCFNIDTIAGQWKYHVLKIIENGSYPNRKIEKVAKNTATKLYKENKRFFFDVGNGDINSTKVLSNILDDTLHVLPLLNTRLLTLLTRRLLSFLMTWLMIKRKLALLCLPRDLFPIF